MGGYRPRQYIRGSHSATDIFNREEQVKMKMKNIYVILLILAIIATFSSGCGSKDSSATANQQTAKVQRGTIKIDVTASGNLALAQTADLAFDVSGYVYKVLVEEGDSVTEGQVLAQVDSFDWEKEKRSLERALVQAKVNLNNAKITLEKAQNPTTTTSAVSGAISAPDPLDIETKQLQVEQAEMALDDAQKELDRYLETSSEIKAPFDGFVTKVNVKGGDEIYKGAVAVSVADPTKFSADILISEMDINSIQIGMPATVELMASSISTFPAEVTAIAPTATNQSGVINYDVEIELLSEDEIKQLRASQGQVSSASLSTQAPSGQVANVQPPSGQSTSGQAPSGQFPFGQSDNQTNISSSQSEDVPWTLEQLRDGFSVTITIVTEQKQNVLMVPNKAISRQGTNKVVTVMNGDITETRVVKTGISNSQYTEIVEGLSEGEQVVTTKTTTSTTTQSSTSQSMTGGAMGGGPPPF
jgi:RND family efflux transporter MFP subunit